MVELLSHSLPVFRFDAFCLQWSGTVTRFYQTPLPCLGVPIRGMALSETLHEAQSICDLW